MGELTLVGLHEDGEHILLAGPDGEQYRVRIDEALRAATRRDRPQLEQARAESASAVPPREIQARIRAGETSEDISAATGTPVEIVRRYEGPVLAERAFVAERARGTRIGHHSDSPVLGELVADRLATRDVPGSIVTWDAYRDGATWTVQVTFPVGTASRSARWAFDMTDRQVHALDDEARWLSETEIVDEPIRRHLAAVRDTVFDVEVDGALRPLLASVDLPVQPDPLTEPDPHAETEALLDDLHDRRGLRQRVDADEADDEDFSGFGPQHAFDFGETDLGAGVRGPHEPAPAAHPPASRPEDATDAAVLRMPTGGRSERSAADAGDSLAESPAAASQPEGADSPAPPTRRQRRGRASVPSWDEIVFGARQD